MDSLGSVSVIALHGEHDLSTAENLRRAVAAAGSRAVFDL